MAEAGADMFTFHACVVVGGSNDSSWGQHVYVPCLCCSGWKQWQKLGLTCLRSMFVCVVVGGSNDRSWGQHVYVPCLCVL